MKQIYSRRTGFRNWLRQGQEPAEIAAAETILDSASHPQPSPLTGPAASQSTPTVPPASAITAGEASLSPKVGSTWIHRETGLIVDVVSVEENTIKLHAPCAECDDWVEFVDGFVEEYEEDK